MYHGRSSTEPADGSRAPAQCHEHPRAGHRGVDLCRRIRPLPPRAFRRLFKPCHRGSPFARTSHQQEERRHSCPARRRWLQLAHRLRGRLGPRLGSSAPSLASLGRIGSSCRLCASARRAASAASAVQRRVSAAIAAARAHGTRSRARARARWQSSATAWRLKRPPTSRPNTTKRHRACPPGWSSGQVRNLRALACCRASAVRA